MNSCSTDLVECLKNVNIFPKAFASAYESQRYPDNILYQDPETNFSNGYSDKENWVAVDFNSTYKIIWLSNI